MRGILRLRPGGVLSTGLGLFTGLVAAALVLVGLFAGRLAQGPLSIEMLKAPLAAGLESRIGNGFKFDVGDVLIEQSPRGFGLIIKSLAIRNAQGRLVVAAPKAQVELDMLALVFGEIKPTRLELAELDVRVALAQNGMIALSAGTGAPEPIDLKPGVRPAVLPALADVDPLRGLAAGVAALAEAVGVEKSPLGALVRVGIAHGRLVVEDQATHRTTVLSGFDLAFDKGEAGASRLSLAADGPNGRWSAQATVVDGGARGRSVAIEFRDLSLAEIMLVGGIRQLPVSTKMPFSARLHLAVDAGGALTDADGEFAAGSGRVRIDDPDQQPFQIDEITGAFRLDPAKRRLALDRVHYYAGETHLDLHGAVDVPESLGGRWPFAVGGKGTFERQLTSDAPLQGVIEARGQLDPPATKLKLDRLSLKGPLVDLTASGEARSDDTGPYFATHIANGAPMPLRGFASLWLSFLIPDLRDWFLHNVVAGRLEQGSIDFHCDPTCFKKLPLKEPLQRDALDMRFSASDAKVIAIDGAPAISTVSGSGRIDALQASFTGPTAAISLGEGRSIKMSDWSFSVPDITPERRVPAKASARMQGSMEVIGDYLRGAALAKYAKLPPETARFHGQVDAQVALDLVLDKDTPGMSNMRANGRVTGYGFDKVFDDEKIENGNLTFSVDPGGVRAKGDAKVFGIPSTLEVRRAADGTGEVNLQASLDDATRAKRGIKLPPGITGPILLRAKAPLGPSRPKTQIEADLSRASIGNLVPGWTKASGRPCKATFTLSPRPDGVSVEALTFDGGTVSARGSAEFSSAGALVSAKLSQLRLAANDDMRVEASRTPDGMRLQVHAVTLDARPLLRGLLSMSGSATPAGVAGLDAGKTLDLDLKALAVTGQNGKVMRNVDLKLSRKGSAISRLKLSAKVGRGALTASLGAGRSPMLRLAATDAGAALAFFDFYKHMEAGNLDAAIRMGDDDRQDGSASIDHFVLRDEPAISRVTAQAAQEGGAASSINLDPSSVAFTRFQTVFSRGAGQVSLRDTVMWGSEIGATVQGSVDFARDYVDLHGTFVPAYALNNLFSKIPFFGPLLGGGTNEGLFAVNYRVTGAASSPVVRISLLSAIAPGFLRQIFGAIDGTNGAPRSNDAAGPQAQNPFDFPSSDR